MSIYCYCYIVFVSVIYFCIFSIEKLGKGVIKSVRA